MIEFQILIVVPTEPSEPVMARVVDPGFAGIVDLCSLPEIVMLPELAVPGAVTITLAPSVSDASRILLSYKRFRRIVGVLEPLLIPRSAF